MKFLPISLILILNLSLSNLARATGPEYFSSRDSIKELAHTTSLSQNIIYLGVTTPRSGFLVPYLTTLKVQDLVAMTSYKGQVAGFTIIRAQNRAEPVFGGICKPDSKIDFILKPRDVVWMVDPYAPE